VVPSTLTVVLEFLRVVDGPIVAAVVACFVAWLTAKRQDRRELSARRRIIVEEMSECLSRWHHAVLECVSMIDADRKTGQRPSFEGIYKTLDPVTSEVVLIKARLLLLGMTEVSVLFDQYGLAVAYITNAEGRSAMPARAREKEQELVSLFHRIGDELGQAHQAG